MDMDALLARLRTEGFASGHAPVPLSDPALAELHMPDGSEVPRFVRDWLAFSGQHPALLDGDGRWRLTTARAFVEAEVADVAEELEGVPDIAFDAEEAVESALATAPPALAEVPWVRLDDSATQAWFVATTGEWPVLTYRKEEFHVAFPRFVDYLAWLAS